MKAKGKLLFLILVIAGIILVSWLINTQLNKTTETLNEGAQAQGQLVNQELPVIMPGQAVSVGKEAITIIGAAPVEQRLDVSAAEKKREASVFQSQNPVSSNTNNTKQENMAVSSSSGIAVTKEPTAKEKKEMSAKGTIIF